MSQNPNIILAGRQPDLVNTLNRANVAAAGANQIHDQNALRQLYQTQGAEIAAGNPQALNALAALNPQAALDVRNTQNVISNRNARTGIMQASERRAAEEYARQLSAAERQQQAAEAERELMTGISMFKAGDLPGLNALMQSIGEPPLASLDEFPARAVKYKGVIDALVELKDFEAGPKETTAMQTLKQRAAEIGLKPGTPEYKRFIATMGKEMPQFSVTTADGTSVSYGTPGVPGGQNAATTNTPRDPGKLAQKLSEKDATTLAEISDAGRGATEIEGLANQLGVVAPNVGYSGPGGQVIGKFSDIIEGATGFDLPGSPGARGAMSSLGMEAQLAFTEKTKGAITDREMGMFKQAVPGMGQVPEANQMIAEVMQAGAARLQTRDAFYQAWARKNGSLEGANEVWSDFMRENPIIEQDGDGIRVRKDGDWRPYISRRPANAYTPEAISQMSEIDLSHIPIEQMTDAQLDAIERRFNELGL